MPDFLTPLLAVGAAGAAGVLTTGLLLGIRHGFDWDHIAAITDITSTTATADLGSDAHLEQHRAVGHVHEHEHGGASELRAHDAGPGAATATLVLAVLGLLALAFGALLPEWVDPIMGRVVGVTLLVLGVWVFFSLWQFLRHGRAFRLRSRWMLVFDGVRYAWRRFQARLHGHEHHDPMEMSSYGKRTAFGVGMIHGVGAETGSQVLLITAVGGAAGQGLGVPMMFAFILGLLIANTLIVVLTASGFVASQLRQPLYIAIGLIAGAFSIAVGLLFLFGAESAMPDLERFFSFIGA
jgi:hypothetical protein